MVKYRQNVHLKQKGMMEMNGKKEALKSEMIEKIRSGGAWFTTRKD